MPITHVNLSYDKFSHSLVEIDDKDIKALLNANDLKEMTAPRNVLEQLLQIIKGLFNYQSQYDKKLEKLWYDVVGVEHQDVSISPSEKVKRFMKLRTFINDNVTDLTEKPFSIDFKIPNDVNQEDTSWGVSLKVGDQVFFSCEAEKIQDENGALSDEFVKMCSLKMVHDLHSVLQQEQTINRLTTECSYQAHVNRQLSLLEAVYERETNEEVEDKGALLHTDFEQKPELKTMNYLTSKGLHEKLKPQLYQHVEEETGEIVFKGANDTLQTVLKFDVSTEEKKESVRQIRALFVDAKALYDDTASDDLQHRFSGFSFYNVKDIFRLNHMNEKDNFFIDQITDWTVRDDAISIQTHFQQYKNLFSEDQENIAYQLLHGIQLFGMRANAVFDVAKPEVKKVLYEKPHYDMNEKPPFVSSDSGFHNGVVQLNSTCDSQELRFAFDNSFISGMSTLANLLDEKTLSLTHDIPKLDNLYFSGRVVSHQDESNMLNLAKAFDLSLDEYLSSVKENDPDIYLYEPLWGHKGLITTRKNEYDLPLSHDIYSDITEMSEYSCNMNYESVLSECKYNHRDIDKRARALSDEVLQHIKNMNVQASSGKGLLMIQRQDNISQKKEEVWLNFVYENLHSSKTQLYVINPHTKIAYDLTNKKEYDDFNTLYSTFYYNEKTNTTMSLDKAVIHVTKVDI